MDDFRNIMTVWIVGQGRKTKVFNDGNEAFHYRGELSHVNGHHKHISIHTEVWTEEQWHSQAASSSEGKS